MVPLEETSPLLVAILRTLGDEYGPLGVALAAAQLSDIKAVAARLGAAYIDHGQPEHNDGSVLVATSWVKPLPPRPKAAPAVTLGAAALGTARPGSGTYVHGEADREQIAETVLRAVGFNEIERLAARLWTENILLQRQLQRLTGDEL